MRRPTTRHLTALCATAVTVVAGCSTTVRGNPVAAHVADEPIVAAHPASALLLSADEVNAAMHATAMVAGTSRSTFLNDSGQTTPPRCLAVSDAAKDAVYASTAWKTVHVQGVREPGDDFDHLAHQAVVSFARAVDADLFMMAAARVFLGCADQSITVRSENGESNVFTVDRAVNSDDVLAVHVTRQGGGWWCQRGMASVDDVVADVATCSSSQTDDSAAVTIARAIADKIKRR